MITVWLPVRVLPAPPRSPALTPSSPSPRNTLDFPRFGAGVMARSRSLRETKTVPEADWGPSSLASEIRFPVRGEGPGQRLGSLRQRPVCMQEIRGPSALQTDADRGLKLPPPAAYGIREGISERLQVVTPDLIGCGGRPHWSGERPFQLTDEARSIVALIDELDGPSASDRSFVWRRSRVTGSSRAIQSNSESDALRTDRIPRLTRRLLGAQPTRARICAIGDRRNGKARRVSGKPYFPRYQINRPTGSRLSKPGSRPEASAQAWDLGILAGRRGPVMGGEKKREPTERVGLSFPANIQSAQEVGESLGKPLQGGL